MTRMKGVDLFCASQASTAICMSMDQRSIVQQSGRAIDRHNPHLREVRRSRSMNQSSSQPPTETLPYHQKSRKSTSSKPSDLFTPPGSSRYLLSNTPRPFFDVFDPLSALVPIEKTKPASVISSTESAAAAKLSSSTRRNNQVVVLRVSLHCKGCEGKVRKHISRMEGVTSFSIDFATKKVTVVGDVTPLSVLASVSRVKNAQLWPSSSVSPLSVGSTH
ncbi:hypothetical protein IFM89_023580 [Coptis chinensis]|uniref:HMA domain-containing protein n=1 Tax=Coptis chinensis TaxID=261450 RepID=A0A835HH23_9MAGN|nr:hypothetical protein IFM89_023580 [Coptis chinensis]